MTAGLPPDRDRTDIEALVADRYLDRVLAAAERGADDAPADAELDPETRRAVGVLRRALVRVHPSFRFEERLASRLAALADAQARRRAAIVVAFPAASARSARTRETRSSPRSSRGALDPADDRVLDLDSRLAAARRPLLVGGAITSAALSLVGVAWVAWRATRPGGRPALARCPSTRSRRAAARLARSVDVGPDRLRCRRPARQPRGTLLMPRSSRPSAAGATPTRNRCGPAARRARSSCSTSSSRRR